MYAYVGSYIDKYSYDFIADTSKVVYIKYDTVVIWQSKNNSSWSLPLLTLELQYVMSSLYNNIIVNTTEAKCKW